MATKWSGWDGGIWNAVALIARERGIRNEASRYAVVSAVEDMIGYWDLLPLMRRGPENERAAAEARVIAAIDEVLRRREFRGIWEKEWQG